MSINNINNSAYKKIKTNLFVFILGLGLSLTNFAHSADLSIKKALCQSCHGENGTNLFPNIPNLEKQNKQYLLKQLQDFKSGKRVDVTMEPVLKLLTDEDIEQLATHFSKTNQE